MNFWECVKNIENKIQKQGWVAGVARSRLNKSQEPDPEPEPLQQKTQAEEPEPQKSCGSCTSSLKIKSIRTLFIYYFSWAKIGRFYGLKRKDSTPSPPVRLSTPHPIKVVYKLITGEWFYHPLIYPILSYLTPPPPQILKTDDIKGKNYLCS